MTSVLTFILLVVLGGGVGLLVVSLAESSDPTAETPRSERGDDAGASPASDVEPSPVDDPEPAREPDTGPVADPEAAPEPAPEALVVLPASPPAPDLRHGQERVIRHRQQPPQAVPRSRVAVEGQFADVARVPLWRRLLAVVGILAITGATGVAVAAVLAALFGAIAEVLGNTIG